MDQITLPIKTYGCKVNSYDTGLLQQRLKPLEGYERPIYILNTCAVTAEATKEAVREVRRIKRKSPNTLVVVTGCAAQVDTDQFEQLSEADLVVANSHKGDLHEIIFNHLNGHSEQKVFKSNIFKKEDLEAGGGQEHQHTRSFLKIQDGCNSFCTFCVIPFARGKSRSIPVNQLVAKVNELHTQGVNEVVITGVHIGDYEDDAGGRSNRLEDLIEQMLKNTKMPRFRVSSLEPIELTPRLLDLYADDRMCRHFHMSMQSAQTRVLKDMKRNYGQVEVKNSLMQIYNRYPEAFVGMDVIVGFPGETESEFQETYDCFSELPWTRIHVFPYSPRPGTYAARLENPVPRHEILKRAQRLRELSDGRYAEKALLQVGSMKQVLVLKSPSYGATGLARDYWPVAFEASDVEPGQELSVKIRGYDYSSASRSEGCLSGEVVY